MTRIERLLTDKPMGLVSIDPEAMGLTALERMAEHDIGARVVMDGARFVGLFTERDYARKVMLRGKSSRFASVGGIMEKDVVCVAKDDTIDHCMALMTHKRVRHLPVLDGERIVGLVSIGDIVKEIISRQAHEIEELRGYLGR